MLTAKVLQFQFDSFISWMFVASSEKMTQHATDPFPLDDFIWGQSFPEGERLSKEERRGRTSLAEPVAIFSFDFDVSS